MKSLLFISGGYESIPGIELANKMGYCTIVSDGNPNAPGYKVSNYKIVADTYNVDETLRKVKHFHDNIRAVDGVISVAADVPVTVSSIAEMLGLFSVSIESAILSSNKLKMKKKFKEHNIKTPRFRSINKKSELFKAVGTTKDPLILKPIDSRGSRGVLQIDDKTDLNWAFDYSMNFSKANLLILEEFIQGPQVSTESLIIDGQLYTVGLSDRNYEFMHKFYPYIIENGGDLPASITENQKTKLNVLLNKAALSLGVKNGVIKGDIVFREGEPYIIEIATRLSGGYFCTHEIPLSTGIDFVGNAIKLAMGEKVAIKNLKPKFSKNISQRYIFPEIGKIKKIFGINELEKNPFVKFFKIYVKPEDVITKHTSHITRGGVIIASGNSRLGAKINAIEASKMIAFEYY